MAIFPTLDFLNIKARYPLGVRKITEWIFNQPELNREEFIDPKDPEGSKEQFAALLIQMDPRKLYDIFDSFGINVWVGRTVVNDAWVHCVPQGTNPEDHIHSIAPSRHLAEVSAFYDAFEILEKQLEDGNRETKGAPGAQES